MFAFAWQRKSGLPVIFLISLCFIFLTSSCQNRPIHPPKKTFEKSIKKGKQQNPRLIVLPLQQDKEKAYRGTGLAIHFLLGNVVVLNTGLREFWFGWRVKKIFLQKERLRSYCHGMGPLLNLEKLGNEQGIRYWLSGSIQQRGTTMQASLILTDTKGKQVERAATLPLDVSNHLIGFRKEFLAWMEKCGLPFPDDQMRMALWPEKTNPEALDLLGRALETYYLHFSWGEKDPISLYWFDKAVSAASSSYLAHDMQGWARYKNKDYKAAEESFRSALTWNQHGLGALAGMMWCAIYTHNEDAAYTWAAAKADLRGESRKEAKARVKKRIKRAAGKIKD